MSLTSLGLKGFLASDKGLALSFLGIFSTTVGYGVIILAQGDGGGSAEPGRATRAYSFVSAAPDTAVILSPEGLHNVRVGSVLPGLGTVTAITVAGDTWTISTSSGRSMRGKNPKP
jgi:hypothetical protein